MRLQPLTVATVALVLGGVSGATLLVHLFSVVLGEGAGRALPVFWVRLIAGVAFSGLDLPPPEGGARAHHSKLS